MIAPFSDHRSRFHWEPHMDHGLDSNCHRIYIVGVNIEVPTGKEVSKNGRCLEIGNFDGNIGVWKVKSIPYWL